LAIRRRKSARAQVAHRHIGVISIEQRYESGVGKVQRRLERYMPVQVGRNDEIDRTMILVITIVAAVLVAMAWLPESPTPANMPEANRAAKTLQDNR
jgi:hypothetical protein